MPSAEKLTPERAEELIRLMTDGLVNIVDETGQFLLKLKDGTVIDTKGWKGWEWTHGIALTALCHHSSISPSSASAQHSLKTALDWFELQYKLSDGKGAPKNINTMSPFYSLACFLQDGRTKDPRWKDWCDEWAEWIMKDLPRTEERGFQHMTYANLHENQMWDDTLMMSVIPLAKIGVLLDRPEYLQEAVYQFLLHVQYLADPVTGLWYHGWRFTPDGKPTEFSVTPNGPNFGHNYARALWARGNCWITVSIPILFEIMGDRLESGVREFLISVFKRQVDALVTLQDEETGLWHTLLVDPTSYVETSAAAGFAAGIYAGLRMGLIKGDAYSKCADRALQGVLDHISPNGQVDQVSFGTGMGKNLQFYKDISITPMPYGQALAMAALVEWERLQGVAKA
ncbi:putative glycosyl hydrolase family 88 protein [Naematelia encephala]|uniref:Putative glycosyl hydrolase family 88 protein n=1 Tax=Naematelia encephala TaxID=71784 RepID=A0A1Y2BCG5_9TREE|nr:putative glycosyl hydrolase family 88 protein [Naematelia encephala]